MSRSAGTSARLDFSDYNNICDINNSNGDSSNSSSEDNTPPPLLEPQV